MANNIAGIDLGTTYSGIAILNSVAKPEIVPNGEGERLTPSAVFYHEGSNKYFVGAEAKNSAGGDPKNIAREFKRNMDDESFRKKLGNKEYNASELSSMVLKKLAQDAQKQVGEIKDVVISVPAYFKEAQRNATMNAGKLAGLNVIGIINEPTAAALYYANSHDINGVSLVYDLGGGTFDVTLIKAVGKDIQVLASLGDHRLGGVDFDKAMLELLCEKYENETNLNLYSSDEDKEEFLLKAEELKKKLSIQDSVKERLKGDGGNITVELTRKEFEEKIQVFVAKTELLVEQVMNETNLKPNNINRILLVGGSTRMPVFKNSIKKIFSKEPLSQVNIDEAVALGAALKAGLITAIKSPNKLSEFAAVELSKTKITDVANHSYGELLYSNKLDKLQNCVIIPKNTPLPCSQILESYTICDNQTSVICRVTQGEGKDAEYVDIIHEEIIENLPPNRPKGQPMKTTFSYDVNQIMHCVFEDVKTGMRKEVDLSMQTKKSSVNIDDLLID